MMMLITHTLKIAESEYLIEYSAQICIYDMLKPESALSVHLFTCKMINPHSSCPLITWLSNLIAASILDYNSELTVQQQLHVDCND